MENGIVSYVEEARVEGFSTNFPTGFPGKCNRKKIGMESGRKEKMKTNKNRMRKAHNTFAYI